MSHGYEFLYGSTEPTRIGTTTHARVPSTAPEELARERELEERAEEQLERAELVYAMRAGAHSSVVHKP